LVLRDLLTKQITHLNIDIKKPVDQWSDTLLKIIALILSLCKKLTVLNFGDMFITRKFKTPVFFLPSESSMSSTLMKLKINVLNFADCLCVLDGRFTCLSTLIINVHNVFDRTRNMGETVSIILNDHAYRNNNKPNKFILFIEKTSQIEIFLIHVILSDI